MKQRKKKRILRPPAPPPKPPVKTADAIVLNIVNLLGFLIATAGVVLAGWAGFDTVTHKYRPSILLTIASLSWCVLVWMMVKLAERAMKILKEPLWEKSAKELKRIQILMLSLHPLILFTTAMPLLYSYGYIARFSNWVFGLVITRKLSENWSLVLGFVLMAMISGVIGNFSYDVIKYSVKKLYKPE